MSEKILTQERLKELIQYNTDTGVFINKVSRGGLVPGAICGHKRNCFRGTVYLVIKLDKKDYYAHRLAWFYVNGYFPNEIDHIDGNSLNNSFINLRNCEHSDNLRNQKKHITNTSGVTGVYWDKNKNKWEAKIGVNNKLINIGSYYGFNDAVIARKMAEYDYGFYKEHGVRS